MIKQFNHFLTITIIIAAVLNGVMVQGVFASEPAATKPAVGLYLSPNLCLLEKNQDQCELLLDIRWRTITTGDFCLTTNQSPETLKCWRQLDQGKLKHHFRFSENLEIYLVSQKNNTTVYKQTVRLQKYVTKYRKKRRNPWQFY
ncbi:MAG: DUF3019 domain-containing protein [Kangiellaceae bacterium]|nr:DUF3019 domain-containing protein [Kangiellaceae bacterium]